jgi:hypothetical protein
MYRYCILISPALFLSFRYFIFLHICTPVFNPAATQVARSRELARCSAQNNVVGDGMGEGQSHTPQLLITGEEGREEGVEMGGDSDQATDSGLTNLRAVWFLVLWYFFSGDYFFYPVYPNLYS